MESELKSKVIFIMGVSGSGKTSVGKLLASKMALTFIDADDHHPQINIDKMSSGVHLTDHDREPWLDRLHQIAYNHLHLGCVIACSALKQRYRDKLSHSIEKNVQWVYLKGDYNQIFNRMKSRKGHFMNPKMLESQFTTLEEPKNAIEMSITNSPEIIVEKLKTVLK